MSASDKPGQRLADCWRTVLVCSLLCAATVAVYWPVRGHDFIIYDDGQYVQLNPHVLGGLSWAGVKWAFTSTYASNWHPLTWLSHMLDVQLFGLWPGGHHLTNLVLHTLNSLLLLLALRQLTGAFWRSALVAGLFALHPVHVESVAWAAERKDVLSAFFFMLTLWAYAQYVRTQHTTRNTQHASPPYSAIRNPPSAICYALALLCYALGLMSKPMLVTLPFVLLLLDYWPLGRWQSAEDRGQRAENREQKLFPINPLIHPSIHPAPSGGSAQGSRFEVQGSRFLPLLLEKLPFLALSAASCVVTFLAQKGGGAVASLDLVGFDQRAANALVAYFHYVAKMFWPARLALLYLAPNQWPFLRLALAAVALVLITILAWVWRRNRPYVAVGWLWYLGTLVPVIGLVQVGNQFMADRYTYLPLIGCFMALVWGAGELSQCLRLPGRVVAGLAGLLLGATGLLARGQVNHWRDSESILTHCLAVTEKNSIAHNNLGAALAKQQRYDEAKTHFMAALEIRPGDADVMHNLGLLLLEQGQFEEGMSYLRQGASIKPSMIEDYATLGSRLDQKGKTAEAIACYREYLQAKPDSQEVCNNLAWILASNPEPGLRNAREAVRLAEHACGLTGYQQTVIVGTLAAAYAEAGRFQEAVATAEKAVALAAAAGQKELAARNRQLLELYRAGKTCREGG